MMRDPAPGCGARTDLDGANPARFRERDIRGRPPPDVLMMRRHGVGRRLDHQIGLAQFLGGLPFVGRWPLLGRRHVLGVALRARRSPPSGRWCGSARRVSDMSFLNFWTPTVGSMCQGGIWRVITRWRMDLAQGRVSSYVTSDMGAMEPGRWHSWQRAWKMGAMSLVKVTGRAAASEPALTDESAAVEEPGRTSKAAKAAPAANTWRMEQIGEVMRAPFGNRRNKQRSWRTVYTPDSAESIDGGASTVRPFPVNSTRGSPSSGLRESGVIQDCSPRFRRNGLAPLLHAMPDGRPYRYLLSWI